MHPPLKVAVFGWRGVLWDNLEVEFQAVLDIFHTYGAPVPERDTYRKGRGPDFAEFCYANGLPGYATKERIIEIRRRAAIVHSEFLSLHYGAREILATCINRGLKTAIVSKELTEIIESRLWQFDLTGLVNLVRGGAADKKEVLLRILQSFGVEPAEAIFIEDTFDGLVAAKETGMRTIGVTYGHNDRETILRAQPEFPSMLFRRIISLWDVRKIIHAIKRDEVT